MAQPLPRGRVLDPPGDPADRTFAVLTRPDAHGAYWVRRCAAWYLVRPVDDPALRQFRPGCLVVLHAAVRWTGGSA